MSEHPLYRRIIAGETGWWTSPLRAGLRVVEALYARGVAIRNARYDRAGPAHLPPVPVVSVGNLTVGGTGKTPFVIDLVNRLDRMGFSPAVVSRGYRAADGEPNEEERLIRKSCPGVACVSDPDRVRAAEIAHHRFGADVIILDDGFQHRRLGRTLDVVLVDSTCPFGFGHLLPRGLLREPVESLRRAQVVALTRCDQVSRTEMSRIETRLHAVAVDAIHVKCRHRVTAIERLDGTAVPAPLDGKQAVVFAGIGQPQAFLTTVRSLGVDVVGKRWWPDHHHYRLRDIDSLIGPGRYPPHDLLLTTEKDAVKLADLSGLDRAAIGVVKVAIDFVDESGTMWQAVLEKSLSQR